MTRHVMFSFLQSLTGTKQNNAKHDKGLDEKPIKFCDNSNKLNKKLKKVQKVGAAGNGGGYNFVKTKSFLRKSR